MQPDEIVLVEPEPRPVAPVREPFWGYTDLALVMGLLFASIAIIVVAAGVLAFAIKPLGEDPTPLLLPLQLALYVFVYFCFYVTFKFRYGRPVFASLGWRKTGLRPMVAAVSGAALAIGVSVLATLIHTPKVKSPIDEITNTPLTLAIFGVMAITVAPLFEELFFRGFIQPLLSRTFGVVAGVVLTAVFFGALHAPEDSWAWQYALAVSIAGGVFGWVRARTQSIIPSTIMHGSYNAVFIVALIYMKYGPHK
jgi:membrane protease YdiL (CAAX protease family)